MVEEQLGNAVGTGNGIAALGTMIGMAMVNQLVDAMVRPETIMRATQDGQLSPKAKHPSDAPAQSGGRPDNQASAEPKEAYERKGVDKLIAYATDPKKLDENNQEKLGLVFQRSGFADWKLTEIRLPALNK